MLAGAGADSPALDARLLLAAAAGLDMAALIARDADPLPALAGESFTAHLKRRMGGEPVARILGHKEFWGLPFIVNAAVLAPRPETETLVEAVLEAAPRLPPDLSICDLGTGSGAILIALLSELPRATGVGIDISEAALEVARRNAETLGVAPRGNFRRGDFADGLAGPFHVVVSNPPYVESGDIGGLPREVRDHDPRSALDGGPDGLAALRAVAGRAARLLQDGGLLALEVGKGQAESVAALCRAAGLQSIAVRPDLSGTDRVVLATFHRPAAAGAPKRGG